MKTDLRHAATQSSFPRPPLNRAAVRRARHAEQILPPKSESQREMRATENAIRELRHARYAIYACAGLMIATVFGSGSFLYSASKSQLRTADDVSHAAPVAQSSSVRSKDAILSAQIPSDVIERSFGALELYAHPAAGRDNNSGIKGDRLAKAVVPEGNIQSPPATNPVQPSATSGANAKTALIDFETAPFPYNGNVGDSAKRFLDAGEPGNRGHTTFRGRVLREATTFNDRRVLLHIPQGFNPNKPGVIVVFFHGHGANLSDDVRDRQQVPAQISASGVNAVMVAPQFAVNAADSSSGKFWEQDGFKRFMDESAKQFAKLNGDSKAARAFSKMPIVIVAYSGGFGPTLSVLEHGGVNARIRGIVLLDALYAGTEKFADWIAANRSAFFVSAYTPHTRRLNAQLEQMLDEKSIVHGDTLRPNRLPGSVTFLPAGDISHRDFVTHAWADDPIKDIMVRFDEVTPNSNVAARAASSSLFVARR